MPDTPTATEPSSSSPKPHPAPKAKPRWRVTVPDEAPGIFKTKLRWAYPAYRA